MKTLTKRMGILDNFTGLQNRYLLKELLSGITLTLMLAILTREVVENFDSNIILLKNYLSNLPMLFIVIPLIRKWINNNPIICYRLKGILSIAGIFMLLIVELVDGPKWWYLVDAVIVSFTGLLMMSHKSYYNSYVVDKNKEFSKVKGYVDLVNETYIIIFGLSIVFFDVPTVVLLMLALPIEIIERYLENKCVDEVFN